MVRILSRSLVVTAISAVAAQCPFGHGSHLDPPAQVRCAEGGGLVDPAHFLDQHTIKDANDDYLTSDVGGPIEDQNSLKAGERGPTLLEDFIFRQKITHFDHERVPKTFVKSQA